MKLNFIAELAQGYEGKLEQALELIHAAKLSNADYVKIQIVYPDELSTKDYYAYNIFKSLKLTKSEWLKISNYSKKLNINLITEIFGEKSLETAKYINSKFFKIHPTDINNYNLIGKIKKLNPKKIFVGIGGAKKQEIFNNLKSLQSHEVVLLHGHQTLPTPNEDLNISRIKKLSAELKDLHNNFKFGIADHVIPNDRDQLPIISLAIGSGIDYVEKHLTTNRVFKLEDYESALNPDEFKKLVSDCNRVLKIYGNDTYRLSKSEIKYRNLTRRVFVAKTNIKKKEILTTKNLTAKRSAKTNGYFDIQKLLGRRTRSEIKKDTVVTIKYLR
jgi:N,N'-diacetyllegionaminate synthase